jgi:hypothetical protein
VWAFLRTQSALASRKPLSKRDRIGLLGTEHRSERCDFQAIAAAKNDQWPPQGAGGGVAVAVSIGLDVGLGIGVPVGVGGRLGLGVGIGVGVVLAVG